jgi:hypothetical protein
VRDGSEAVYASRNIGTGAEYIEGPPVDGPRTPPDNEEREPRLQKFTGKQGSGNCVPHEVVGTSRSLGQ